MKWLTKAILSLGRSFGLSDPRLSLHLGGTDSYSGRTVTVDSALQIATVWACVRLLSETIATLPLGVYERDSNGRRTPARDHPLYALLHDQPNADMTAAEFWQAMMACVLLWGNAYARKETLGGRLVALSILRPEAMVVRREKNGDLTYVYSDARDGTKEMGEAEIFHIKGFSLDGLIGLSPIAQARHTLGLAMAADEAAGKLYSNGLRSSAVMEAPHTLTPAQRKDADAWLERFRDAQNAGKIPLVEAGFVYKSISLSPADAQMMQVMAVSVEQICSWYGVPPFMVGHTEKTTSWGTGLEQQNIRFLTYSLRPYLTKIEQAVKRSLISPQDRSRYYAEFNLEGLLRADSAGRAALYATFAQNGVMTRNEMRERENLEPLAGGDVLTVQSNLLPLEMLGHNGGPPLGSDE